MDIDDPQISFSLRVGCGGCEVVLGRVEELLTSYPDAELGALVYIDGEADEISRSYPRLVGHATVGFAGPSLDGSPGALPRRRAPARMATSNGSPVPGRSSRCWPRTDVRREGQGAAMCDFLPRATRRPSVEAEAGVRS
jgi:hypothetical protein